MTADAAEHQEEHHVNYVRIWMILVGLLTVSVIGPMFEIRVLTLVTAFGIAIVKAYLVAANFMHLKFEKKLATYMLLTVLVFVFLLFAGAAPDVMNHEGWQWEKPGVKAMVAEGLAESSDPH
jgi:caa(3)-type oxidase subunit IV